MEVLFALPLLFIPFIFPLIGGWMAKSFGRSFWFWFWLSLPLPIIAHSILLCLPEKENQLKPVKDEEIFDHEAKRRSKKLNGEKVHFSARA